MYYQEYFNSILRKFEYSVLMFSNKDFTTYFNLALQSYRLCAVYIVQVVENLVTRVEVKVINH